MRGLYFRLTHLNLTGDYSCYLIYDTLTCLKTPEQTQQSLHPQCTHKSTSIQWILQLAGKNLGSPPHLPVLCSHMTAALSPEPKLMSMTLAHPPTCHLCQISSPLSQQSCPSPSRPLTRHKISTPIRTPVCTTQIYTC